MLSEVRVSPVAEAQERDILRRFPRARPTLEAAFRTIMHTGAARPILPNSGLRGFATQPAGGVPALGVLYSQDADGAFRVEEIRVL